MLQALSGVGKSRCLSDNMGGGRERATENCVFLGGLPLPVGERYAERHRSRSLPIICPLGLLWSHEMIRFQAPGRSRIGEPWYPFLFERCFKSAILSEFVKCWWVRFLYGDQYLEIIRACKTKLPDKASSFHKPRAVHFQSAEFDSHCPFTGQS